MAITADTTLLELYEEVGFPFPNDEDIAAWNYLECGDTKCGTPGETGYWYNQAGMFGWALWSEWYDGCETAAAVCADVFDIENYDGWAVGIYTYTDDISVLLNGEGDFVGIVPAEDD
jgi:hypothetical protein